MNPDKRPAQETPGLEAVEAGLRRLPTPQVPEGLEARLIAAIPAHACVAKARVSRRWRWHFGAAAATAAALAVFVLWPRPRDPNLAQRPNAEKNASQGIDSAPNPSAELKDTDPCNILPPLPEWR